MKNQIPYLICCVIMTQCIDSKTDPIFEQGSNERIEALRSNYIKKLTAPKYGWKGQYTIADERYQDMVGMFTLLLRFKNNNTVTIKSDYGQGILNGTTSYRIDQGWKMELVFEDYSVFQSIAEHGRIQTGASGYTFNFDMEEDSPNITLLSRMRYLHTLPTKQTLLQLAPARLTDWDLLPIYDMQRNMKGSFSLMKNNVFIAKISYHINTDVPFYHRTNNNVIYVDEDKSSEQSRGVRITATGFDLMYPLSIKRNGQFIYLSKFIWENKLSLFYEVDDNSITLKKI